VYVFLIFYAVGSLFRFHPLFWYFSSIASLIYIVAPTSSGRDVPSFLTAGEAKPLALFPWFLFDECLAPVLCYIDAD
jgi:hypothetical protein